MEIDKKILDELTGQAKRSPRLRMNYDLRYSVEDQSQRMLNAIEPGTHSLKSLESGTVLFEAKEGAYRPLSEDELWEQR